MGDICQQCLSDRDFCACQRRVQPIEVWLPEQAAHAPGFRISFDSGASSVELPVQQEAR